MLRINPKGEKYPPEYPGITVADGENASFDVEEAAVVCGYVSFNGFELVSCIDQFCFCGIYCDRFVHVCK